MMTEELETSAEQGDSCPCTCLERLMTVLAVGLVVFAIGFTGYKMGQDSVEPRTEYRTEVRYVPSYVGLPNGYTINDDVGKPMAWFAPGSTISDLNFDGMEHTITGNCPDPPKSNLVPDVGDSSTRVLHMGPDGRVYWAFPQPQALP